MALTPLECPKCGAPLVPDHRPVVVCRFCQTAYGAPARTLPADPALAALERTAMDDESVLALCRRRLTGADQVYFSPAIPPKKEANVRKMHARHLPTNEWILVLFDNTVFGAADDGMVITSRRLCWRNIGSEPGMLLWSDIDPSQVHGKDKDLTVMGTGIEINMDTTFGTRCHDLFRILALSAQ